MYAFVASQEAIRELGSGAVLQDHLHADDPEFPYLHRASTNSASHRPQRRRLAAADAADHSLTARLADINACRSACSRRLSVMVFHAQAQNPAKNSRQEQAARPCPAQTLNQAVWQICDVLRRSNCASALQYVPELTWILFLRVLDEQGSHRARRGRRRWGLPIRPRWSRPPSLAGLGRALVRQDDAPGPMTAANPWAGSGAPDWEGKRGDLFAFVNNELLPHCASCATSRGNTHRSRR